MSKMIEKMYAVYEMPECTRVSRIYTRPHDAKAWVTNSLPWCHKQAAKLGDLDSIKIVQEHRDKYKAFEVTVMVTPGGMLT